MEAEISKPPTFTLSEQEVSFVQEERAARSRQAELDLRMERLMQANLAEATGEDREFFRAQIVKFCKTGS